MLHLSRFHTLSILTALGALVVLGAGCKSKEQLALEKVAQRKPPGYVRGVNLSDATVTLLDGNRTVGELPGGRATAATTLSAGKRTLTAKGAEEKSAAVEAESRKVYTAIVWPDGEFTVAPEGQPRKPEDMTNGWVMIVGRKGVNSSGSGTLLDPSGKKMDLKHGQTLTLMPGEYKSTDGTMAIKVNPEYSYTILFLEDGGKTRPFILLNSDDRKPAAAGQS